MLCVLCGIPASGKTTMSLYLSEQYSAKIHSYDDTPNAHEYKYLEKAYHDWISKIITDLNDNNNVVADNTNLTAKDRIELLNAVKEIHCEKILVVMTTSLQKCLDRNRERKHRLPDFVLCQAKQRFELPTFSEGWDDIQYYI